MTEHKSRQGVVSVFLGVVPNEEMFNDYLQETYQENDVTCPLWDDLGVSWLDHDFQDAHYQGLK